MTIPTKATLITIDDCGQHHLATAQLRTIPALRAAPTVTDYTDAFVGGQNCSSARAKLATLLYSIRPLNWVGGLFDGQATDSLRIGKHLLAKRITAAGKTACQVGKWHLCRHDDHDHRGRAGFVRYAGAQSNLTGESYCNWQAVIDGAPTQVFTHATDWTAAAAIAAYQLGWDYVEVSFNAIHTPYETSPGCLPSTAIEQLEYLDSVLAPVLAAARAAGYAIFLISDNGGTPQDGGKGNLSHKALATLCTVAGLNPWLAGNHQVVDTTDLPATIVELVTGAPPAGADGQSLLSGSREVAFADRWDKILEPPGPGHEEMATDGQLKVIRRPSTGKLTPTDWYDNPTTSDVSHLIAALDAR